MSMIKFTRSKVISRNDIILIAYLLKIQNFYKNVLIIFLSNDSISN